MAAMAAREHDSMLRLLDSSSGRPSFSNIRAARESPRARELAGAAVASVLILAAAAGCASTPPPAAARGIEVKVGESLLAVRVEPAAYAVGEAGILRWVERSAKAVAAYLGRFPVRRATILVRPESGGGVGFATTYGHAGAVIDVPVGTGANDAGLAADWVLPHEMLHFAVPQVKAEHRWLEEGLATYCEPVARARAGITTREELWAEIVAEAPAGQPGAEDGGGLDGATARERVYWGGGLFALVCDVEIRRRTGDAKGLEHALRGVIDEGGSIETSWPIERILAAGDGATGVPVLAETYARMGPRPLRVDLDDLLKKLGVRAAGDGRITFDDAAPWASTRRAIESGGR
jgi:hypothetical protein